MRGMFSLRLTAWAIALTLVALPLVGLLNGWFAAGRWPVSQVQIEAEFNHVSAEQIRAAVAAETSVGFFALDLAAAQRAVATLPWVERVEARKRWPDTLVLRVYELQPFARWGDRRLVGRDGRLFAVSGAEAIQGLPQLSGPDERLADVLAFYAGVQKQFSASGLAVSRVALSVRGSWTLGLDSGAEIAVGNEDAESRLHRFVDVYPRLAAGRSDAFEVADLRYTNGFAMKWPAPAPLPSASLPVAMEPPQA